MAIIKPYFILFNCLLLVFAAYLGVKNVYGLISTDMKTVQPRVILNKPEDQTPNKSRRPLAFYQTITDRNLFDIKADIAENPELMNLETLEQTELKLKLWGTVLSAPAEKSYAVIEDTRVRSQNLYRQGDSIQNAVIKMILREKIVLRVDDRDEILEMEKAQQTRSGTMASVSPRPAAARPFAGSPAQSGQNITIQRSEIDSALENVNDLMQQVRIMPHFENGRPEGFRLSGIRANSLVRKMGLRNGDIITGVNGSPIQTMEDAMGFYQQLSGASAVSLQIKRRGNESTIDYNIR